MKALPTSVIATIGVYSMPHHDSGIKCKCGGTVKIKDWRKEATRQFRFESYCDRCQTCDPDGWPTLAEAIANAPNYFGSKDNK